MERSKVYTNLPVAIMAGRLINNRLLMRLPAAPVLMVSTAGATACFGVILATHSGGVATAALFVAGLFMASVYPTTLGVLAGRFTGASGAALGLAITCGWLGSVVISPSLGYVAEHRDFATAYGVVVASAAAMVLTAAVLARQREAPAGGEAGTTPPQAESASGE